jgi:Family of unknown function (DUF5999)
MFSIRNVGGVSLFLFGTTLLRLSLLRRHCPCPVMRVKIHRHRHFRVEPAFLEPASRDDRHQDPGTFQARLRCVMCPHRPQCPPPDSPDRSAARTVAFHPEQGWSLLCNGVIVFDDTGEILPSGRVIPPHQPAGAALSFAARDPGRCPRLADMTAADASLVHIPAVARPMPQRADRVGGQRGDPLHPPIDRHVINLDAALGQQLLHVAIAEPVAQIPAHRDRDHLGREPERGERDRSAFWPATRGRRIRPVFSARARPGRLVRPSARDPVGPVPG